MPERYEDYDRVAIVTGADSGIGKACALALAEAGHDIGIQLAVRGRGDRARLRAVRLDPCAGHGRPGPVVGQVRSLLPGSAPMGASSGVCFSG